MSDTRADVIGLSDYVYQRTRSRLDGLTDDEYFWEPVSGCWTIRWDPAPATAAEDDKASLVLHQLDEQIHHGAELGVLRDLYRHSR